ncbi:M23 family metallopeptidase [Sphingomonas sp. KRR8]|uniref:M23 family metallopeptidase n=1 Tax=Sphingomonas sp. KRR8 TaxID=2942996 RepID=UPI002020C45C|nr:M23 family metallopeptidase [Sphingomonas sp. KRR8]URD61471.1 M23 family metallopeptidase [Sphingomonas sp. KRR8]
METAPRRSRIGLFGNIIVLAILLVGAWLVWSNVRGGSAPVVSNGPMGEAVRDAGSALAKPGFAPRTDADRPGDITISPTGLALPVAGVKTSELVDTYAASRGGGSRVHNAIDIMAPEGRPVIAAAPGTVEKLFNSIGKGGLTVYVRSDDGRWMYYYAHLSAYDANLKEGMKIRRGDPIGLVGHTGDASADGPHLHLAINRMAPGERWWQGEPINPYPLLAGKPAAR